MLGIVLVILSIVAIVFASYRLGTGICEPDLARRDSDRNTSLVVLALGVLFALCGIMALVAGSNNPFDVMTSRPQPQ